MEIPLGLENTGSTHKVIGTPSRHFVTWQLMEVPQCFFFCFQMLVFSLCCLQNRFFFQSIGGWMMMLNVSLVSSQSSLWIGWLCVILPAIHSQRVKALTSGWVTKLASLTKKTTISCPASLKQNAGFIYADNPNRGKTNQNKFFVPCWKT